MDNTLLIQNIVEELLRHIMVEDTVVSVSNSSEQSFTPPHTQQKERDCFYINITMPHPSLFIGSHGQAVSELQHIVRLLLYKKISTPFEITLDINHYKKKKQEYLEEIARISAEEVITTKQKKILPPMLAYERRIIHMALQSRSDIIVESHGEGKNRSIIIFPR